MYGAFVQVPFALLCAKELTPASKLIWITLRLDEIRGRKRSHSPTQLARRTRLARSTVYEAFARLAKNGWCQIYRQRGSRKRRLQTRVPYGVSGECARIPADLVEAARNLRPQALICFGLLQLKEVVGPGRERKKGQFKWAELKQATGLHLKTLKTAVRKLVEAGWMAFRQKNRLAPVEFELQHPDEAWKRAAERRLQRHQFTGQALMQEFLTLLVDSDDFVDDASAGFLVNPRTQQLLQFDRFYPLHRVAFEFNGRQHYEPTELYSKEQVAAQRERDRTKHAICKARRITLVVVHAEDLSLEGMRRKVEGLLPLRDLGSFGRTIRYLEDVARRYRRAAARAGSVGQSCGA